MVRDWTKFGGRGQPQYIELYNPNDEPIDLDGYTLEYVSRTFTNEPWKHHITTITDFTIAAKSTVILVTKALSPYQSFRYSGIKEEQVFDLNISGNLKNGWVIKDNENSDKEEDNEIHRIGKVFGSLLDPIAPSPIDSRRVSYDNVNKKPHIKNDDLHEYYYGSSHDISSPGFYEPPVPKAPQMQKRKTTTLWGSLKVN